MILKLAARGMQRSWTSKSKNTKEVLHNFSIKGKRMLSPGSVVFAFEIWIGLVGFVAFLLFYVAPIKFQQEREWSEVVASFRIISRYASALSSDSLPTSSKLESTKPS